MFSSKSLSFLRSLKRNNNRDWFHERREVYDTYCRGPMVAVVEELANDFQSFAPEMLADPRVCMLRPFRDTRFSEDKTPLKTHVGATFPNRALGRMNGAGFYIEVAPAWVWIGGGLWRPDASQLQLVREHIIEHLPRFKAIVSEPRFERLGSVRGDRLTRVPRGFAKDHPAADYLRYRQFMAFREEPAAFATRKDFYQQLKATLATITPMVRFLNEPLVDALRPERQAHIFDRGDSQLRLKPDAGGKSPRSGQRLDII